MRRLLLTTLALAAAVVAASSALADASVIPDDGSLPWTDPGHHHPLELLASQVASHIVGRPVQVRCEGEADWAKLPLPDSGGFVHILGWSWDGSSWTPVFEGGGLIELSPLACTYLVRFARAGTKPTKCSVPETEQKTRYRTVRYRARARVRVAKVVRINGRLAVRHVWVTHRVWRTKQVRSTTTVTVLGRPQPCYADGRPVTSMPESFWKDYAGYSWALLMLAHESSHLAGDVGVLVPAGYPSPGWAGYPDYEARAECHGMQRIAYVAEQLGDTADDAEALARFYLDVLYPTERDVVVHGSTYWSASCYANGPLDLTPNDGVWP